MAIGLGDLGKKKRAAGASTKSETVKSTTAKPWSDGGSLRGSAASTGSGSSGGASFDDSFDSEAGPLLWLDHSQTTKLTRLQRKLAEAEAALQENLRSPMTALRRFLNRSH